MNSAHPPERVQLSEAEHAGSRHWWLQRVCALPLIPLTLWFVFAIRDHIGAGHQAVAAWIAQPVVAAALIVYLACLFFHAHLGVQVIVEDYMPSRRARAKTLLAMKAVHIVAATVAIVSVLRIAAW